MFYTVGIIREEVQCDYPPYLLFIPSFPALPEWNKLWLFHC